MKVTDIISEACWKDYKQIGMKKKNGKQVPNCVPKTDECAGVGTITKQNSTVDVNKNTPKKNLKAFKLI